MSGAANYPTSLDDDTSLLDVTDGVTSLVASHHNNLKEAIKAVEKKIGIEQTSSPTSLDYRLGSPTNSHSHNGASGQGQPINASTINIPSGGYPTGGLTLADHLLDTAIHTASAILATGIATMVSARIVHVPTQQILATGVASMVASNIVFAPTVVPRHVMSYFYQGSMPAVGANALTPFSLGRTMVLTEIRGNLRRGPSGATTALDVNVGPTSIYVASQGLRPIFAPGATQYGNASPNYVTFPSGVVVTVDSDAIGSNDPGQDLSMTFIFRE